MLARLSRFLLKTASVLVWIATGLFGILAVLAAYAWFLTGSTNDFSSTPLLSQHKLIADSYGFNWEPLLVFSLAAIGLYTLARGLWAKADNTSQASDATKQPSQEVLARQRKTLLLNVQSRMGNILDQQPYRYAFVELEKEASPNSIKRHTEMPPANLPMLEIFDRAQGWLLILGAPGAGKSTTLYKLAEELLCRAKADDAARLPIVLDLSHWKGTGKTLEEWLVRELRASYRIKTEIVSFWIREDRLILLLDALDEIPTAGDRKTCIKAINEFGSKHSSQVVISSRKPEYDETDELLDVSAAITLQQLDAPQITAFLSNAGTDGIAFQKIFAQYPKLLELARVPLLLNVMVGSVRELKSVAFEPECTDKMLTQQVLDAFVRERLKPTQEANNYKPSRVANYLRYLALCLTKKKENAFLPDLAYDQLLLPKQGYKAFNIFITSIGVVCSAIPLAAIYAAWQPDTAALPPPVPQGQWWAGIIIAVFSAVAIPVLAWTAITKKIGSTPEELKQYKDRIVTGCTFQVLAAIFVPVIILNLVLEAVVYGLASFEFGPFGHTTQLLGLLLTLIFLLVSSAEAAFTRFYVTAANFAPLRLSRFLRYCVKLKLMYRIGPGYSFIHTMLQEHFAELDPERLNLEELDAEWERARRK